MLKKLLGLAPKLESDGSYSPSKMALKMGVADKTDFENITYQKYEGKKSKILVIFTEEKNLKMKNGKFFSTGNHPVEALLPMLHLKNAGFEFEIATPTGKPVVFEMWAFPEKDEHVNAIYNENKASFEKPLKLSEFIKSSFDHSLKYKMIQNHSRFFEKPQREKKLKEKKKVKALSEMNQTLLIFTANWCESCQYTYSMWLKFANRFSTEKLKIVEVDTSRHDAIARKFQVNFRDGK